MDTVIVSEGEGPIVFGMPHGGTDIPADLAPRFNDLGLGISDTDWWIDKLYDGLLTSPTVVRATFSRFVIDANRDPSGASLYPGQNTTGTCPLTTFDGEPIYKDGQEPNGDEIAARVQMFHTPYHDALAEQLERVKAKHGTVVLYDCHSIRTTIPYLFEGQLPVFNIGTNGGVTCDPAIEAAAYAVCSKAEGYDHALNGRFTGGWTTRRYGRPRDKMHAIQMELGQRAYMDEAPPWNYRPDLAGGVRPYLQDLLLRIENLALEGQLK